MLFDTSNVSGSMIGLFNLIILFCGLYSFYAWYQLRDGKIPERFPLLGKDLDPAKCLDEEGYVSYIRPRILIFAIIITVLGALSMLDSVFHLFETLFPSIAFAASMLIGSGLPFLVVVWFCTCLYKIQKDLWV